MVSSEGVREDLLIKYGCERERGFKRLVQVKTPTEDFFKSAE